MDMVPRSWYIQEELKRKTIDWVSVSAQLCTTFSSQPKPHIERGPPENKGLHLPPSIEGCHTQGCLAYHQLMEKLKEVVHCWKIESDDIDEDDLRGIQIKETEGEHVVGREGDKDGCIGL
jgi:hypothetical protein